MAYFHPSLKTYNGKKRSFSDIFLEDTTILKIDFHNFNSPNKKMQEFFQTLEFNTLKMHFKTKSKKSNMGTKLHLYRN